MTKAKASSCDKCNKFFHEACVMGHYPRQYTGGIYKRVCSDYDNSKPEPVSPTFLGRVRKLFGIG